MVFDDAFPRYVQFARLHEAGFDAYITGVVFLSLLKLLRKEKERFYGKLSVNLSRTTSLDVAQFVLKQDAKR